MVARPKTPGGKRVTMAAKFSETEAALVDAARGDVTRSEWLRTVSLAAANEAADARIAKRLGIRVVTDKRVAPGTAKLSSPGRPSVTMTGLGPGQYDCPHPKARINKGLCGACGRSVRS